jgi:large subunit ribosomal protein L25
MEALELKAQVRKEAGKGPARRLRMKGFIPAVFYGSGTEAQLLAVEMAELSKYLKERKESVFIKLKIEQDGKQSERLSMIKELQTSPVSNKPVHADFLEVLMDHKISLEVPIHFIGNPVGVESGGELQLLKRELMISGLPGNVPESVQVDISGLKIGDSLNVGDIPLGEGVESEDAADIAIATVWAPKAAVEAVEGEEEAAPAEPEVVGKKPAEE